MTDLYMHVTGKENRSIAFGNWTGREVGHTLIERAPVMLQASRTVRPLNRPLKPSGTA